MFSENESTGWVYLGKDSSKRRHIEKELGSSFKYIDIAKLHNQVADDLRHEYVRWIDELNRRYGGDIEWWFGSISSRNPYNCNIFQYCCYLEILERLWTDRDRQPGLIMIESIGLASAIQKWAAQKNTAVNVVHYNRAKLSSLITSQVFFLRWGNFFITLLARGLAYNITKIYSSKKLDINPSVILDTFVHDYCLSDSGAFKDRYFPYLHEYLSKKGMVVLVHPVLVGFRYNYFPIYRRMRISDTHFILQEDFLHFSDYFFALIYPLKVLLQKIKPAQFRTYAIHDILREENMQSPVTIGMEAVLIYRLFLRLERSKLRPEVIIDWYENQVIDKALIAGARKAFPRAKIIGAQMFIHSSNFISLFPSQSEADAHIVPHLILETSQYQCKVAQSFTKTIPCKPVAALRYFHLFSDNSTPDNGSHMDSQKILVLLPFSIDEAVELLNILKGILERIGFDVQIMIKGHPDYTSDALIHAFGEQHWPKRFKIFNGTLHDALNSASVVVSSNSSSMVEAAAKGIPVIFLGRQTTLNYNMLSNLNMDIVTECFSASELIKAIEMYLNLSPDEKIKYTEMGRKVRDKFFEPVNDKTLLPFLGDEEAE